MLLYRRGVLLISVAGLLCVTGQGTPTEAFANEGEKSRVRFLERDTVKDLRRYRDKAVAGAKEGDNDQIRDRYRHAAELLSRGLGEKVKDAKKRDHDEAGRKERNDENLDELLHDLQEYVRKGERDNKTRDAAVEAERYAALSDLAAGLREYTAARVSERLRDITRHARNRDDNDD